ncbi:MAG TPA: GH25 family lysozyme [Acidimicrobiales bacterium]
MASSTHHPGWRARLGLILMGVALVAGGLVGGPATPATASPSAYPINGVDAWPGNEAGKPCPASTNDWGRVRGSGREFVTMKATRGTDVTLSCFTREFPRAVAAGLAVAPFHYYVQNSPTTGAAQADRFINVLRSVGYTGHRRGELPPVLDLEGKDGGGCWPGPASVIVADAKVWLNKVEAAFGRRPIIYTNRNTINSCMGGTTAFGSYPLQVAHWTTTASSPNLPAGWTSWLMWQYGCSDIESVPGMLTPEYCVSVFNGTQADLDILANRGGEMPAATSTASRMDVFVRGTNFAVFQNTYTGSWSGWRSTGNAYLSSAPAAVAWTDRNNTARIDLFGNGARKADGSTDVYWQTSYDGGQTWQGWQLLPGGGHLSMQPAAAVLNGTLYVFGRGIEGHLYSQALVPTWQPQFGEWAYSWAGWQRRTTDVLNSPPSATRYGTQLQVTYTRSDLAPYQTFTTDGTNWTTPAVLGGADVGAITGAMGITQRSGEFRVYGRGTTGNIFVKSYGSGSWGTWNPLNELGTTGSGIGAATFGGDVYIFALGPNGEIRWTRPDLHQGWNPLGGQSL